MASTGSESTSPGVTDPGLTGKRGRLGWIGRQAGRAAALLVWAGVCGYAWFRGALATPYTVAAVGGVIGVALLAGVVDDGRWLPASRSGVDRWLLAGCLLGVVAGTVGVGQAVVGEASRPDPVAGTVLIAALVVLAGRLVDGRLAGAAALALAVAAVADPTPDFIAAVVTGPVGVYGAPTRAITWLGPVCLLAGLWAAAGVDRQWRALWPVDDGASGAATESRRLVGVTVLVGVLIAWRTAGTGRLTSVDLVWGPAIVLPVALLPAALLPAAMVARSRPSVLAGATDRGWASRGAGRLIVAAGPVALMGWLLVGPRPPVGVVLVAGCLLAVGLCLLAAVGRAVSGGRAASPTGGTHPQIGGRTVVDGAVEGAGLLARVVVVLAVVGAAVAAAETVGLSTRLLSAVLWLGGGHPVGGLAVLGGLCVAVGAVGPTLAGYAAAALVVVPLVRTLAGVDALVAQLGVWYAVAAGALLAVLWRQSRRRAAGKIVAVG